MLVQVPHLTRLDGSIGAQHHMYTPKLQHTTPSGSLVHPVVNPHPKDGFTTG